VVIIYLQLQRASLDSHLYLREVEYFDPHITESVATGVQYHMPARLLPEHGTVPRTQSMLLQWVNTK